MRVIDEYIKTIENELNQINCFFDVVYNDTELSDIIFIQVDSGEKDDVINIIKKYNFVVYMSTHYSTTFCRGLNSILDEIRVNGLKELIR